MSGVPPPSAAVCAPPAAGSGSAAPCIRALPAVVANQIAAGEVVERPASVVKELVENSIDARATRIDLVITAGGRKLVSVADDGVGMVRDDALMCLERQATSKIRTSEDIASITTMGFRGEAIPSIASVSRFRLTTRPHNQDAGTEVLVNGGELADVRDCGCPAGTLVEVRDLFFNLPARRKFLRTYQTEQSVIRSMFLTLALANPSIAFTFKADGLELHNLPPCETFQDRLRDLYGADCFAHLRAFDATTAGIRVHGYVSTPDWTRADRAEQYLFVNRRPASAPVVYAALREGYPPLEADRKPIVFLFLDLDPAAVDVNVHPTKREVRFRQPAAVREAILRALGAPQPAQCAGGSTTSAESGGASAPGLRATPAESGGASPPAQCAGGSTTSAESGGASAPGLRAAPAESGGASPPGLRAAVPPPRFDRPLPFSRLPDPLAPRIPLPQRPETEAWQPPPAPAGAPPSAAAHDDGGTVSVAIPSPPTGPWKWCRIHGALGDHFALLETDDGLVVLEPRAAHTRVLYEELLPPPGTPTPSQRLLLPETFSLPPVDAQRVRSHLASFQSMGFGLEPLDGDAFLVDALPAALGDTPSRPLLIDIAAAIEEAGARRGQERWVEEAIARAAARHAVSLRRRLSPAEIESIVRRLVRCRMPYTSPFGKPTIVLFSYRELSRKFGLA